jgi:hypothetical protein
MVSRIYDQQKFDLPVNYSTFFDKNKGKNILAEIILIHEKHNNSFQKY